MRNNLVNRSSYKREKLKMLQYIRERKAEEEVAKKQEEAKIK